MINNAPRQPVPIPPGPADVTHPRRALARLALSTAAAELADVAAGLVPTVSDDGGHPADYLDAAARLLASAQALVARAVVYACDSGGHWSDVAAGLDVSEQDAHERYGPVLADWDDALNRPWERSGHYVSCRLPDGASDPADSAAYLDRWCGEHLGPRNGARRRAERDGIAEQMVSAMLPTHTLATESASLLRTAAHLSTHGAATDGERDAYQARKRQILDRTHGGSA